MSIICVPDHVLKASTDPEAHAELVRRGLRYDPTTAKRSKVLRGRAEDRRERRFSR